MPRSTDGRWTRNCEVCGLEFQQRTPSQRTCSVQCRGKLWHNTGGVRAAAGLEPQTCPTCGEIFTPVRRTQIACSRACYRKTPQWQEAQRRQDARPERRAAQNTRRRSRAGDPQVREANMRANLARHGVTLEQFDAKVKAQDGVCALCGKPPNPHGVRAASRLHQDHDHVTGHNRDLLCNTCNAGIGLLQDDPALLRAAAEYIERHRSAARVR